MNLVQVLDQELDSMNIELYSSEPTGILELTELLPTSSFMFLIIPNVSTIII